jgi:hypothetical protein
MTSDQRTFNTGVDRSVAALPDPPAYWSYSTLKEVETCPRRYVLGHADYPNLWSGFGYPQRPHPAALFGDFVHDSLERIIKVLVGAGCDSSNSPEAVAALRDLGGYSVVVATALRARLAKLEGNPRIDGDRRERLQQQLEGQIPEARTAIQGYLQRISLAPKHGKVSTASAPPGHRDTRSRRPLGVGTHSEAPLWGDALRVKGRVDLLTVAPDRVDIVDHKTGAENPSHLDQLRFYAMLWDQDKVANSARTPLGELTASYPANQVKIPAPKATELQTLFETTKTRVAEADQRVLADRPAATSGDHCQLCPVRSICATYWLDITPDPATLADGTWFDFEGVVGQQNGAKSWWMLDSSTHKPALLLRSTSPAQKLVSGQRIRLLGLRRDDDPEDNAVVASLTTNSEVFLVTGESDY